MPVRDDDYMRARREEILDAATETIRRLGIANASLVHICKDAGLSKGALYIHFKSKDDILLALLRRQHAGMYERLSFEDVEGLRRELLGFVDLMESNRRDGRPYSDLEIVVASRSHPVLLRELCTIMRARGERFRVRISELQRRGALRDDVEAATVAVLVDTLVYGMVLHSIMHKRDVVREYRKAVEWLVSMLDPVGNFTVDIRATKRVSRAKPKVS